MPIEENEQLLHSSTFMSPSAVSALIFAALSVLVTYYHGLHLLTLLFGAAAVASGALAASTSSRILLTEHRIVEYRPLLARLARHWNWLGALERSRQRARVFSRELGQRFAVL